jgi:hypothetical protein
MRRKGNCMGLNLQRMSITDIFLMAELINFYMKEKNLTLLTLKEEDEKEIQNRYNALMKDIREELGL